VRVSYIFPDERSSLFAALLSRISGECSWDTHVFDLLGLDRRQPYIRKVLDLRQFLDRERREADGVHKRTERPSS
jgi:hypothetical protein